MRLGWAGSAMFWLHRLSGIGVALFLLLHVGDTALIAAGPQAYDAVMAVFARPAFRIAELALIAAVIFHAVNGVRITVCNLRPHFYSKQPTLVGAELIIVFTLFVAAAYFVLR